jgi:AcrR family transcriptional regulator
VPSQQAAESTRLDRQRIVDEALRLVDEEGFGRLTMRNLAGRLDVVPMALYRYVGNKEGLVDAVFETATGGIPLPAPDLEWRAGLGSLAQSIRRHLLEHPAIAIEIMGRPSLGPAALDIAEYGYRVMRRAGFTDTATIAGVNTLVTYVLGFTALEVPRRAPDGFGPSPAMSRLAAVYDDLPVDRYPHTASLQPAIDSIVTPEQFERGLQTILDGLEHRLDPISAS